MYMKFKKLINSQFINILVSFFILLYVFLTPIDLSANKYGGSYLQTPDTTWYFDLSLNPWGSVRTPGYALFLYPFLEPHRKQIQNILTEAFKELPWQEVTGYGGRFPEFMNAAGLQNVFDRIALTQRILLSMAAAFLVYACSLYFNPLISGGCFLLGITIVPLVNSAFLLTESVAQPMSFFALGFLLLFFKKRNFLFLFFALLCASFLYLMRPAGIYMLGVCGIAWIYLFWKENFHHAYRFLLASIGFLPSLLYIMYISITAGYLIFGTFPWGADLQFSSYFLQNEDIENMPTMRSKEYAIIYLDTIDAWKKKNGRHLWGDNFEKWPVTKSFGYRYSHTVWPLAYTRSEEILRELRKNPQTAVNGPCEMVKLGRELKKGVLKRHKRDFFKTVGCNFLTSLGYYRDFNSSSLWKYGFPWIVAGWGVWVCALLLCPHVRFCLVLLGGAHLFHMVAVSYGNFILPRYVNLTETFFLFAVLLSLWSLIVRIWKCYENKLFPIS